MPTGEFWVRASLLLIGSGWVAGNFNMNACRCFKWSPVMFDCDCVIGVCWFLFALPLWKNSQKNVLRSWLGLWICLAKRFGVLCYMVFGTPILRDTVPAVRCNRISHFSAANNVFVGGQLPGGAARPVPRSRRAPPDGKDQEAHLPSRHHHQHRRGRTHSHPPLPRPGASLTKLHSIPFFDKLGSSFTTG